MANIENAIAATQSVEIPEWFTHDRFGLFVHFGLYSALARHEWVRTRELIEHEDYVHHAEFFNPDRFDATAIAKAAKQAGMRYVVLTAKHHEGYALWNTQLSDFSATRYFGRDLIAEFTEAVRAEGLRVGLYFSVIDWQHEHFTIDGLHPMRNQPDAQERNASRDMDIYREFLHGQVREVLTGYGQIDYLFYDFTYPQGHGEWPGKGPEDWDAEALLAMTRQLQPGIVVNDRLGIEGDLVSPEQYQPDEPMTRNGEPVPWEACQTLNGSWGYDRDNLDFKPADLLVRMLIETVSLNGNQLLNIGPDGRGAIPKQDAATLEAIGEWMELHQDSIIGAGPAELTAPAGTVMTQRGDRIYLHVFTWPFRHLHLADAAEKVRYARFLHDGAEVKRAQVPVDQMAQNTTPGGKPPGTLTLTLPVQRPDVQVPVIELFT